MIETKIIIKNYKNQLSKIVEDMKDEIPAGMIKMSKNMVGPPSETYPILSELLNLINSMDGDIKDFEIPE